MSERSLCYNKLWKIVIDKKISFADFRRDVDISSTTLTKLRKDKEVAMSVLIKICDKFDCDIADICEYKRTGEREK